MLLGDSAYAISDFLIKPILNAVDPSEIAYTAAHCRTRATVERAIGQMKRKFPAMHNELRYEQSSAHLSSPVAPFYTTLPKCDTVDGTTKKNSETKIHQR